MTAPAVLPRVVFVDDDPSMRRFVGLALEDLALTLVLCPDAAAARAALREAPAVLVLTDIMMPGETGLDLLASLVADPALRGPALLAVFSAGVDAATREALDRLGVWRELTKPVALGVLQACVSEAVAAAGVPPHPPPHPPPHAAPPAATGGAPRDVIERLFGGDAALHAAFRAQALAQFPADLAALETAQGAADWPAVRRQAHSLKGALSALGDVHGSLRARRLEDAAAVQDEAACRAAWPPLRGHLQRLIEDESDTPQND